MHLKNFSIIVRDNKVELSPAYDLLNTTIALPNPQEEMALPVAGKKSNIRKETLLDYFAKDRLDLTDRSVENVINDLRSARPVWDNLLDRSFLSVDIKAAYRGVVAERWSRLDL